MSKEERETWKKSPNASANCVIIRVIEMGDDDGSEKVPRPPPDEADEDAEARARLLDNGVNNAEKKSDHGMAAADRIEAENGKRKIRLYI